jgi:NADPH:quinone reductase-like Zn-dependent oxidoreductase
MAARPPARDSVLRTLRGQEVGAGVAGVAAGDEVLALTRFDHDGVAADYTAVPAERLMPGPRALSHAESAAIPLPALTAWHGLFDHGRLDAGKRVLINGAAGSVGGFAVQLADAAGARVIGTASAANRESVLDLGAHQVVDGATRFEDADSWPMFLGLGVRSEIVAVLARLSFFKRCG